jgi:hypothetical protein
MLHLIGNWPHRKSMQPLNICNYRILHSNFRKLLRFTIIIINASFLSLCLFMNTDTSVASTPAVFIISPAVT